ncbi:hypothetical protein [Pseudomonas aeruginosa]|uniref:hypothetical protein n=1 Tax=Pseudomonas aeruginosa TaxID=287 RepID=UPI0012FE3B67|nr:hypothetical protein [Pseudomonas aeruginosa]EKU3717507.1 hypothetical protein [Pseudomonas aeruginosa]MCS8152355.1 hypothetical protein [Pseudomonas aeruginosa]UGR28848.1 hypothetical protein LSP17_03150 [Pseudomonas aeruginosa]HBO4518661.1 hypothetical protein [Pseudomonas aeruginosa]HBO5456089.1 hypothetical protein [Pseudomonas aeruginosa]
MKKTEWAELLERAEKLDEPLTDEELSLWKRGLLDGNSRMWNVDYVHAVQRAIEGHDREELDAMLMAEIPIPTFLLPFLVPAPQGRRPAQFTALEDKINREMFERSVRFLEMSPADAKRWISGVRGAHVKTIERSLKRTE